MNDPSVDIEIRAAEIIQEIHMIKQTGKQPKMTVDERTGLRAAMLSLDRYEESSYRDWWSGWLAYEATHEEMP